MEHTHTSNSIASLPSLFSLDGILYTNLIPPPPPPPVIPSIDPMDQNHPSISKQTRFVNWLTENNARFPKLEFRDDVQGCGSVYCSEDIAEDEVFLSVPSSPLVLTEAIARDSLPPSAHALDGRTVFILFLIQQSLLKEKSFYHPYLDMIPERIYTALDFDERDMEQLRGTNAFLVVQERKSDLRQKYEKTMGIVGEDLRKEQGYTWERFLWAETVLSSRAFPATLFGGGAEGEIVLIPLGDMLNHKGRQKLTWMKTPQGLEMSGSAVSKGNQVFNNYGPKSNEELLVGYGFCIENNMDDLVMLKTNFSRDPEQERKTEILKHVGITTQTVHYLRHDSIPTPLLVTMRVMAMNPMEIDHCFQLIQQQEQQHQVEEQEMEQEEELENRLEQTERAIAMALKQELEFLGLRNEFAMLDLLDMLLGVKLQGILEWDDKLDKPQNQAQEFARIYRQGQSQVLQACEDICRGMFSVLLHESSSATLSLAQAVFLDTSGEREQQLEQTAQNRVLSGLERRIESPETYDTPYFKAKAQEEIRTMSELKRDAVQQVLLTARGVMMEHRDGVFGEALGSAFPEHGWGDETWVEEDQDEEEEMAIQMEQDAILTCFLVFENQRPVRFCNYITAAKKMDYSSLLEEDMKEDVEDLRQSLQEPLEAVNPEAFNFSKTFTRKAFVWATGILEALSLSLHIDGEVVTGVLAPRDVTAMESGRTKRKHE